MINWIVRNTNIIIVQIFNFIEKAKLAVDKIKFDFTIDSNLSNVNFGSVDGMNIYRIVQEVVHNSIKYANANEIFVDFRKENNSIQIKISDNGIGFDLNNVTLGNGIFNIKKRVKDLHGTIEINSENNKGTIVLIQLPYKHFLV